MARLSIPVLLCLSLFALQGCGGEAPRPLPPLPDFAGPSDMLPGEGVDAPWDTIDSAPTDELAALDERVRRGELPLALSGYSEVEAKDSLNRDYVFRKRMSVMLKLGRSKEVLIEISKYSNREKREIAALGPEIAAIVAYAYEHERDIDQTFAWFGVVGRSHSVLSSRARREATRLVRRVKAEAFERIAGRWAEDSFMAPIFAEERMRRVQGGEPERGETSPDWFNPQTYQVSNAGELPPPAEEKTLDSALSRVPQGRKIGVILPLSGQFAEAGTSVKRGVELAAEGLDVQFLYRDADGEPEMAVVAYDRLVREDGVSAFLGPLLAKSSELVAQRSRDSGVPFIAFTKKSGVTGISPAAFRLGVTADNQIRELLGYASKERGVTRLAVLAPQSPLGDEFMQALERIRGQVAVSTISRYQAGIGTAAGAGASDLATAVGAAARIQGEAGVGIFIADTAEGAVPILSALRGAGLAGVTILGPAVWDDAVTIRANASLFEGAVFVTPFFALSRRPNVARFVELYRGAFGEEPDLLAAQAYDAARLLLSSLTGDNIEPQKISNTLKTISNFDGVSGLLTVSADGEINRRMSVIEIREGEELEVSARGIPTGAGASNLP